MINIHCPFPKLSHVSAPIYNHNEKMVAAMSISVPVSRITLTKQAELAVIIRKGAEEVSRNLGYEGCPGEEP
jgi:IclR family KDG regulon transcriptional repressor